MSAAASPIPLPRLNQRLEVAVGGRGTAQYFSRLVEETSSTLRISTPEMEGRSLDLREGQAVRVWYTQAGGYWCLSSAVRTVFSREGEPLIEIDRQGEVHRAQRRNHVRVDVSLLLHGTCDPAGESEEPLKFSAVTRNVSGGGVSFRTNVVLENRTRLALSFYLPEHAGDIHSKARIVHVHPDPERDGQYIVACSFERMTITDRERIVRFLFFRQRELARRSAAGAR